MPTPHSRMRAAALCCAAFALTSLASVAEAKSTTVPGDLRVVTPAGRTLAEHTQYTGTTRIRTSRQADCFGKGTGGSGEKVKVPGPTALGILDDAARPDPDLKPLSITDAFSFGLGLCGIGGYEAPQQGYWYLKVNHVGSQTGGDQTRVRRGDEVLWYLIKNFNSPTPGELRLKAPARARPDQPFTAKVLEYADDGTKSPAEGAKVTGAAEPADAKGEVTLSGKGLLGLRATKAGTIPSNEEVVCARRRARLCPAGYERTVAGSSKPDRITGSRAAETILAGGGDDRIVVRRRGERDRVKCGAGRDRLTISRGARVDSSSCERIVRR